MSIKNTLNKSAKTTLDDSELVVLLENGGNRGKYVAISTILAAALVAAQSEIGDIAIIPIATGTPASPTATGTKGTVLFDATYLYVCTATDTWIRIAIDGTWS